MSLEKLAARRLEEKKINAAHDGIKSWSKRDDEHEDSDREKLKELFNKFMGEEERESNIEERNEEELGREDHYDGDKISNSETSRKDGGLEDFISHKMEKMKDEDYPQKQKLAIAYSYAKKAGLKDRK